MLAQETGTFVDVDGLKTYCLRAGDGPALVLLHGASPGACTTVNYGPVIQPLADASFTVIGYDQPGFGLTANPADHSMDARIAHAKAFLDVLGYDRYLLVGNSMGAHMAAVLAVEYPRVAKVVLVAGGVVARGLSDEAREVGRKHGVDLASYTPSVENMRTLTQGTLYKQALVTDELVRLRYDMSMGKNYEAQQKRREAAPTKPIDDLLPKIGVPTLIMWGKNDRGSVLERAYRMFEAIHRAELHAFDESGHWPMWDQTDRFVDVVSGFLKA